LACSQRGPDGFDGLFGFDSGDQISAHPEFRLPQSHRTHTPSAADVVIAQEQKKFIANRQS
jgi:hypothetical protein